MCVVLVVRFGGLRVYYENTRVETKREVYVATSGDAVVPVSGISTRMMKRLLVINVENLLNESVQREVGMCVRECGEEDRTQTRTLFI
jgi:hypothetical protein